MAQLNAILGTSYTLCTAGVRSVLEDCISEKYDFGTAYARLRPFWYGDLATLVDDLSEREVQYRRMLQDVLVNDRIIYPHVPPRRVWDLYSNRVVPWCVARQRPCAISHAWMDKHIRKDMSTAINGYKWPVPIPKDMSLDRIRIEMLNLGAEYVWLDVLCLRQEGGPMEDLRVEEWKVDVPTIGSVYAGADKVVCYLRGLGQPFTTDVGNAIRCWFKRAWTLQEISEHLIIGGDTGNLNEVTRVGFEKELLRLQRIHGQHRVYDVLAQMQERVSTNPVDRVAGMAYLLHSDSIPAYYEEQSEEDAWTSLVDVTAHQCQWDLLFLYPQPGDGTKAWRPSWRQVMTEIPQGQHHSNLQIGCWNQDGKTDANVYYNGYIIEFAFIIDFAFIVNFACDRFAQQFTQQFTHKWLTYNEQFTSKQLTQQKQSAKQFAQEFAEQFTQEFAEQFAQEFSEQKEFAELQAFAELPEFAQKFAQKFAQEFAKWHELHEFAQLFVEKFAKFAEGLESRFARQFVSRHCQKFVEKTRKRHYRVRQIIVKDNTGMECSFEITFSHQYLIPNGSYTLLGTTAKSSSIHWVIGRRLSDERLKKLSIAQMSVEVASMDSLVSQSIAKRASATILA